MELEQILDDRALTHGDYTETARYQQTLKNLMRSSKNWAALDTSQAQALDCVCDKIARIICGNHAHLDHWQDGQGYFALVVREMETARRPTVSRAPEPIDAA
jgi:hypothetical protein